MSDPYAPPPRPADEPPSQPFQPMSYDLAPEFTPPPNPAAPGYPPAGGAPYPAPPPQPQPQPYQQGYQAPGYAAPPPPAPVVPPQVGFPVAPPTPPRKRRGLAIVLSIIGAVVVLCGVLSCVFAYPIISESGATVSAPSVLPGGLTKDTSESMQQIVDQAERQMKSDAGADQAAAGFYNDSEGHQVILVAVSGLILSPGSQVDDAFNTARGGDFQLDNVSEHDAGKLGGTVKCGTGTVSEIDVTACVWGDHGSVGLVIFFARGVSESVDLFLQIREAVEKR